MEADECMALQSLIDKTMGPEHSCSADEYLHGDDDLPVCVDLGGDNWEANFLAQLNQSSTTEDAEDEEDVEEGELDEEPISTLNSFSEAMKALDSVKLFLESKNCIEEAITVGSAMDTVASAHLHCTRQTTLHEYFTPASASTSE